MARFSQESGVMVESNLEGAVIKGSGKAKI
jgi:hypothetical protein